MTVIKPTIGEPQWGQKLNDALDAIVDDASATYRSLASEEAARRHRAAARGGELRAFEISRTIVGSTFVAGTTTPRATYTTVRSTDDTNVLPIYRYSRSAPVCANPGVFPDRQYVKSSGLDSTNGSLPLVVEFHTDALSFDIWRKGNTGGALKVYVDGEVVLAAGTGPLNVLPGGPSDGQPYYPQVTLPSTWGVRQRHIRVEGAGVTFFGGIAIPSGTTVTRCNCKPGPKVIAIGDSFTEGTVGGEPAGSPYASFTANYSSNLSYATLAGKLVGWPDTWPSGSGGTGYLNPGSGGRKKFRDRVTTDVINQNADIVIVAGGFNDSAFTGAQVSTEAGLLFDAIVAALPDAAIVVVGPFPVSGGAAPAARLAIRDALAALCLTRDLLFIDPIAQGWVTTANAAAVIGTDGTHPTIYGHQHFARMFAANLAHIAL